MGKRLAIPQYLDYRQWEKHKSPILRILKKDPGITDALKGFETAYLSGGFGWGLVDDSSLNNYIAHLNGPSISSLEAGLDVCKEKDSYLSKVQMKLAVVKKIADDSAREFKLNQMIPSSTRLFLENMSAACSTFVGQVRKQIEDSEKRISEALKKAGVVGGVRLPTDLNPDWWKAYKADTGEYLSLMLGPDAAGIEQALEDYWRAWKLCQDPRKRCMAEYRKAKTALENAQKAVNSARAKLMHPNTARVLNAYLPMIQKALQQIDVCVQDYKVRIDKWASTRVEIRDGMRTLKQEMDAVIRKCNAAAQTAEGSVHSRDLVRMKFSKNLATGVLREFTAAKQAMDLRSRDLFGKAQHLPTEAVPHPDDFPDNMKGVHGTGGPWSEAQQMRTQLQQDFDKTEKRLNAVISQLAPYVGR
jgi:hypothetical protein